MGYRIRISMVILLACIALFALSEQGIAENDVDKQAKALIGQGKSNMIYTDFNAAKRLFEEVYKNYSTSKYAGEAVYLAGLASYYQNDFDNVVKTCEIGLKQFDKTSWISKFKFLLASGFYNQKKYRESSEILLSKAIEYSNNTYLIAISKYYLDIAEAAYIGKIPESKTPYASKEPVKNFNKALNFFIKARGVKIGDAQKFDICDKIATCYFELKNYRAAIKEFNTIINTVEPLPAEKEFVKLADTERAKPFFGKALFYRGQSRLLLNDWKNCRADFLRVIREYADTDYKPLSLINIAKSHIFEATNYGNRDAFDKAWGYFDLFFSDYIKHEKAPEFLMLSANFASQNGFSEKAILYWNKMLKYFPENKEAGKASYLIGATFFNLNQFDNCREQFKSFLSSYPAHQNWNDAQNHLIQSYYNEFRNYFNEGFNIYKKYCHNNYAQFLQVNEDSPIIPGENLNNLRSNWLNTKQVGEYFLSNYPVHGYAVHVDVDKSKLIFNEAVLNEYMLRTNAFQDKRELTEAELQTIQDAYLLSLENLRNLASKYSRVDQGAEAQFHAAEILEYQIGNLADAIKEYEKVIKNFRYSSWGYKATAAIQRMKKKEMTVISKRTFTSDEKPTVNIRTRNIKKMTFKAYRLNLKSYFERHRNISNIEKVAVEIIAPTKKWEMPVEKYSDYKLDVSDYELNVKETGAYIVEVQGDIYFARVLVVISDIEMIVKQSPKQLFVFAKNEVTGEPENDVDILYFDGDKIESAGKTDARGILVKNFDTQKNNLKVFAHKDKNTAFTSGSAGIVVAYGYTAKGYIFSDRSVYRPGDTVKFKGILRDVENGVYKSPSEQKVLVTIKNPRGIIYFSEEMTTTEFGSVAGEFDLTRHSALGDYLIYVEYGSSKFSGNFKVEEYKKPNFVVSVKPDKQIYLTKEEVKCAVNVKYYFGKPVKNANIQWRLYSVPYQFDKNQFSEFAWFYQKTDKEKATAAGMRYIKDGTATCDENGETEIVFSGIHDYAEKYYLEIDAQDEDRSWASGAASVILAQQEFYALLKINQNLYRLDDTVRANLFTVTSNNLPTAKVGEIKVMKVEYVRGREIMKELETIKAATLENGKIDISFKLSGALGQPGHYRLHYIAYDKRETPITADIDYFVLGTISDRALKTRIVADKQIYFEGETANFMINSPSPDTYALITFEGENVLDYDVVKLTNTSSEYKVNMKSMYSPNIFVKLTLSTNHEWFQDDEEILVFRFLDVKIKAVEDKFYSPGEKAKFAIETKDQNGNPVAAEFALSLVDEAIYAIAPDSTPDIKPFFYDKKRSNAVNTFASYDWRYVGNTQLLPVEMMSELERRFQEMNKKLEPMKEGYAKRPMTPSNAPKPSMRRANRGKSREMADEKESEEQFWGDDEDSPMEDSNSADDFRDELKADKKSKSQGKYPQKGFNSAIGIGGGSGGKSARKFVQPTIRKVFRDTAAFLPFVTTDETGNTTVELTLPDNLTTWRATVRGITKETLVGEAVTSITVTKGILARLEIPRFLNKGDRCAITGSAHNYLKEEMTAKTELSVEGGVSIEGATESSLRLKPGAAEIVDFNVRANKVGDSRLTFKTLTTTESDAEQQVLSINAFGDYKQFAESGSLISNNSEITFDFPKSVVEGSIDAEIALTPGSINVITDALSMMVSRYSDNASRIITTLYSALLTYDSLNASNGFSFDTRKELTKYIKKTLLELYDAQHNDGSFGWLIPKNYYRPVSVSPWLTAYALLSLKSAQQNGFVVDGNVFNKTANAVVKMLKAGYSDNEKCVLGYAYAVYAGSSADRYLTPLFRRANKSSNLNVLGMSALALGLKKAGNTSDAWTLVEKIATFAKTAGKQVYWDGEAIQVRNEYTDEVYYSSTDRITTSAWAFAALTNIQPNSGLIKSALSWLMANRYGRWWYTGRTTADVIFALNQRIASRIGASGTQMTVSVLLNGEVVKEMNFNKAVIELGDRVIRIPADKFKAGANTLTLNRTGFGDLNYSFLLKYYTPADFVKQKGNLVSVDRYYFKYEGESAYRGNIKPGYSIVKPRFAPIYEPAQIKSIASGEVIQVELHVSSRANVRDLIVEDYLPAGCEVTTLGRNNAWQHYERRDNKAVFYLGNFQYARKHVIRYAIRAINPGIFRAMPSIANSFSKPEIFGNSNSNNLNIYDKSEMPPSVKDITVTPDEIYANIVKLHRLESWEELISLVSKLFQDWDDGEKLKVNIVEQCLYFRMRALYANKKFTETVSDYERLLNSNPNFKFKLEDNRDISISYFKIDEYATCARISAEVIHNVLGISQTVGFEYRGLGEQLKAQQYLIDLWQQYPDYPTTIVMYYQISKYFANIKIEQQEEQEYKFYKGDDVDTYVGQAYEQLQEFMAIYPTNELTDDAMYDCLRYAETMNAHAIALQNGQAFLSRFGFGDTESIYLDDVLLAMTKNYYQLEKWEKCLETAILLVNGKFKEHSKQVRDGYEVKLIPDKSPYKQNAQLFIAKIYHAQGKIEDALKYYTLVSSVFPDAKAAIEYFTASYLETPESDESSPDKPTKLKLQHKNLKKVHCAAYKIDLLILFSLHKSLGNIRNIELTGIDPTKEFDIELKNTTAYRENDEEVDVPLEDAGVYLLIFTADHNIHKTTVVIKSELEMRIQRTRDYVRVYITKRGSNVPVSNAYVKIAQNSNFIGSGKTDSRGVFEISHWRADQGKLGVVAQKDDDFAFAQD